MEIGSESISIGSLKAILFAGFSYLAASRLNISIFCPARNKGVGGGKSG
jgi:hypothetical protein